MPMIFLFKFEFFCSCHFLGSEIIGKFCPTTKRHHGFFSIWTYQIDKLFDTWSIKIEMFFISLEYDTWSIEVEMFFISLE